MYPLIVNLQGRLGVVIGGGAVGRRKAATLLDSGARVRLVCLENAPAGQPAALEWRVEPYRPEHLDGAALVFAAAPPEVNRQVVADARRRGLWVNAAHDPAQGDFLVPATVRRGPFLLAVSTGGAAPGLAHAVREQLAAQFDDLFGRWVALLAEVRPDILTGVADAGRRRTIFASLCRWQWLDRLRQEGEVAVRQALRAEVQSLVESSKDAVL
jgi:precorrin-2 dehydrogenase/sirohydrochlorin ferrochelatase